MSTDMVIAYMLIAWKLASLAVITFADFENTF